MKLQKYLFGLCLVFAFRGIAACEEHRSGLQVGQRPTPFNVRDCTGPASGKTLCYFCRYGSRPVVSVFTNELNDDVINLVKEIDTTVGKNRAQRMAAFVVLLADDVFAAEKQLKKIAEEQMLRRTPLTIFRDTTTVLREVYAINPDAAVTVMMWDEGKVEVNRTFADAKLDSETINSVIGDSRKILD